jgi:hypothetical protein
MTDHNSVYKTPESELIDKNQDENAQLQCFYVVSRTKFCLLYITTMGIYIVYWGYENWRRLDSAKNLGIWPIPRAIFNIFFTHSLYKHIDRELKERHIFWKWHPTLYATIYVIFELANQYFQTMNSSLTERLIYFLFTPALIIITMIPALIAQQAINTCEGDPSGSTNNTITLTNALLMI